tara:strand:- start:580 stop:1173 length:594 start_codon:yes stop_codon:yes gene_type:complete
MLTKKISVIAILAIFLASCSMVKSPQSSNFQKVKYNAHLKKATNSSDKKLATTINSFDEVQEMESNSQKDLATTKQTAIKSPLLASVPLVTTKKEVSKINSPSTDEVVSNKLKKKTTIFNEVTAFQPLKKANESIVSLNAAAAAEEGDGIGGLLYLLLVIILVLIILGLISDIGGGAIGTLIAVLLILLILRLLGVI